MCLADRLKATMPDASVEELAALQKLAETFVFTSQGVPSVSYTHLTLLLGDLLNFVVSNKKLSIMNKFVEITVDGEKCIINASAVQKNI